MRLRSNNAPSVPFSLNRLTAIADMRLSPALFGSVALVMAGVGLLSSAIGLRAAHEGFGTITTGVITAGYYLGFLAGAVAAPSLVARAGHIRSYAACTSIASGAVLAHVLVVDPFLWTAIRVATGAGVAGVFVVVESWLNELATNETRGRLLSAYAAVTMIALAAGQLLLNVASVDGFELFVVGSMLLSAAVVPLALARTSDPVESEAMAISLGQLVRLAPVGLFGVFLGGLLQGALLAMGAVYASNAGFDLAGVSGFMALVIMGGFFGEWPLGWLSDRMDRRRVVLGAATAATLGGFVALNVDGMRSLLIVMTIFGAFSFPIYPLSVAVVNDRVRPDQMVPAASRLLAAGGVGAFLGPVLAALGMQRFGPDGFLWSLTAATIVLALASAIDVYSRSPIPATIRGTYVPLHPTATAVATALHPDSVFDGGTPEPRTSNPA